MPQGLAVYHAVKPTRDNETYYAHGHLLDFPRGSDLVLPSGRFSLADPGCICGCPNIVVHCRLAMRVIHNQGLPCPGEGFCCSLHFPHGDATGPNALELIWKPSDDDMAIFGSTNPDDWPNEWAWRSDCADDHGSSSCPTAMAMMTKCLATSQICQVCSSPFRMSALSLTSALSVASAMTQGPRNGVTFVVAVSMLNACWSCLTTKAWAAKLAFSFPMVSAGGHPRCPATPLTTTMVSLSNHHCCVWQS